MGGYDQRDALRLERQIEYRATRPSAGPCLLCGRHEERLIPGRLGGVHVYCALCAIGTRTPATIGGSRDA